MKLDRSCPLVIALLLILEPPLQAQLVAYFTARSLDYDGSVDDCDPVLLGGLPTCELYFRMGVFVGSVEQGSAFHYPGGCGSAAITDGIWNFADQTIVRSLPNLTSQASAFFALLDDDSGTLGTDDDLLGTHLSSHAGTFDGSISSNNNLRPSGLSIGACEGGSTADDDVSNRFGLSYRVRFTDSSPPSTPNQPSHQDSSAYGGWDDDTTLDFSWPAASDPHSGVGQYEVALQENGVTVWTGTTTATSIVRSGSEGNSYRLYVRARNGAASVVALDNPSFSAWSTPSNSVTIDLINPTTTITDPPAGSWQSADFDVVFTDADAHLANCEVRTGSFWTLRTCNAGRTISVGPASACSSEGANTCQVRGRSQDQSGRVSSVALRSFSIDTTAETIDSFTVLDEPGGTEIPEGVWTQDRDPMFSWTSSTSISPLAGYSYSTASDPDCTAEGSDPSYEVPTSKLADGSHRFRVRALDVAGNCGPVASRTLQVDGTPDPIVSLLAYASAGGEPISDGVPQFDVDPYLEWEAPPSTAPIAGYSTGVDEAADCVVDTVDSHVTLGPLPSYSSTIFAVRAIDEASNCGPEATFEIVVDDVPVFDDGFESGDTSSWSTTIPRPVP